MSRLESTTEEDPPQAPAFANSIDATEALAAPVPEQRPSGPGAPLQRGDLVGRYIVLDRIGAGAMGVVYAAYDPQLDRKIALKVLRGSHTGSQQATARLHREAQTLARLTHPNVVSIYDFGAFGEGFFIAMEFVDGENLGSWLERRKNGWREVVAVFLQAGAGLAAAHEGGIIHRDFKPDNVLVGTDGRAKVVDFGIARAGHEEVHPPALAPTDITRIAEAGKLEGLTRTGALLGTPAYMAPEQHLRTAVDARADQFGFCVALHEALFGQRPFRGETILELLASVLNGRIEEPRRSDVPQWVRRIIRKGLSVDPKQRYPSMPALLADLAADPALRVRRLGSLGLLLALGGGLAFAVVKAQGDRASLCHGAERHLEGAWDEGVKSRAEQAFLASRLPYAERTWGRVGSLLDRYAVEWASMHVLACEATRVHGEQSEDLLDRRMACLDRKRRQLGELARVFTEADEQVVEHAVQAAESLPDLDACADVSALLSRGTGEPEPLADPAAQEEIEDRIARSTVLSEAAKYPEAMKEAKLAEAKALELDAPSALAAALTLQAKTQELLGDPQSAEATLRRAATAAERSGDDVVRADVWLDRASLGIASRKLERSEELLEQTAALHDRIRAPDRARGRLAEVRGLLWIEQGRHDDALRELEIARRFYEKDQGPDSTDVGKVVNTMGIAHDRAGRPEQALEVYREALALLANSLGPDHPELGGPINNIAVVLKNLRRFDEALEMQQQSLQSKIRTLGERHPRVATSLMNVANVLVEMGRPEQALEHHLRARDILEQSLGDKHVLTAMAEYNLGVAQFQSKRYAEALTRYERAAAIQRELLGEDDPELGYTLSAIGVTKVALGQTKSARVELERALELLAKGAAPADAMGECRFALARALGREDRARAQELATQARLDYAGSNDTDTLQQIDQFLARR